VRPLRRLHKHRQAHHSGAGCRRPRTGPRPSWSARSREPPGSCLSCRLGWCAPARPCLRRPSRRWRSPPSGDEIRAGVPPFATPRCRWRRGPA
jgi:hypothetical protein